MEFFDCFVTKMEYQFHNAATGTCQQGESDMLPFALNHMTAPRLGWEAFLDLAAGLGCVGVEFRNDLPGALFGGADPATVGAAARARNLRFLALAEVKMFNDWSDARRAEAEALMQIAVAAGAEAVSLIPRNDGVATDRAESRSGDGTGAARTAADAARPWPEGHGGAAGLRGLLAALQGRCWPR